LTLFKLFSHLSCAWWGFLILFQIRNYNSKYSLPIQMKIWIFD